MADNWQTAFREGLKPIVRNHVSLARWLAGTGRSLRIAREAQRPKLRRYFLVQGKSLTPKVDLEALARELGAMEPWETVEK